MRILEIITRSEVGGGQTVAASLAGAFAGRGHEVLVASGPEGGGEAWRGLDPRVGVAELPGLVRSISPLHEIEALRSVSRLYRSFRPDIAHLHTSKAGAIGRLAPGVDRRRIVYTMHGYDQLRIANRGFLAVDRALRRRCGAVVAVSGADLAAMKADGYDATLVRNGVAEAPALPPGDPSIVDRLESIRSGGRFVALMIARDARPKRIDLARAAAARLGSSAAIAWIGGRPEAGDPPGFVALGEATGAAAYLRYADAFLLASDHEGLPISLLEALSAGIPIVASAVGGCIEALGLDGPGRGTAGIAVENDSGSIAEAILRLAREPELRARMRAAARASWERGFSIDAMAEGYISLFRTLVDRRSWIR
jgi:glycosyltransferase involved in cell wall biosynthesis